MIKINKKRKLSKTEQAELKTRPWYLKPLTPYQNDVINNELSGYKFTIDEDGKVVQFKPFFSIEELNRKKDKRIVRERIEARRNRRKIKRLWSDPPKSYHLQREVIGINR